MQQAAHVGLHDLSAHKVYLASHVTTTAGGLLPHPFTFTIPKHGSLLSVALAVSQSFDWDPSR